MMAIRRQKGGISRLCSLANDLDYPGSLPGGDILSLSLTFHI